MSDPPAASARNVSHGTGWIRPTVRNKCNPRFRHSPDTPNSGTPSNKLPIAFPYFMEFFRVFDGFCMGMGVPRLGATGTSRSCKRLTKSHSERSQPAQPTSNKGVALYRKPMLQTCFLAPLLLVEVLRILSNNTSSKSY